MPIVYLIPSLLDEEGTGAIPPEVITAIKDCAVFFVENERTTRRYFKKLYKEMVIDDHEWIVIGKAEEEVLSEFKKKIKEGKNIGIVSEAGCPGIADPGQKLVAVAQESGSQVKPLTGPSSILLALMASGMNGQEFRFCGYLPIDTTERIKAIRDLETESSKKNCTQIFIETPYRNNQVFDSLCQSLQPGTRLCIAVDLTGKNESVRTLKVSGWKKEKPELHKRPAIFLVYAGDR